MNPNCPQNNLYPPLNPYNPHPTQAPIQYNQPHPPSGHPVQNQSYQPPQQNIQPGYVPLVYNPYGNLSPEQLECKTKLDNIDKKFRHGFLQCYLFYMYFSAGWTVVNFVSLISTMSSSYPMVWKIVVFAFVTYSFLMYWIEVLAIKDKSLTKANLALILMIIFSLPIVAILSVLTISYINWIPDPYDDTNGTTYFLYFLGFFYLGCMLLFHFIFNIVGAVKVRDLLGQREIVLREGSQHSVSLP